MTGDPVQLWSGHRQDPEPPPRRMRHAELYRAEYARQLEHVAQLREAIGARLPMGAPRAGVSGPAWDAPPPEMAPRLAAVPAEPADRFLAPIEPTVTPSDQADRLVAPLVLVEPEASVREGSPFVTESAGAPEDPAPAGRAGWRWWWLPALAGALAVAATGFALLPRSHPPAPLVIRVAGHPTGLAVRDGRVWIAAPQAGVVRVLDAATGRPAQPSAPVGGTPTRLALDTTGAWVADAGRGTVVPPHGRAVAAGPDVADVALGAGVAWLASPADGSVRALARNGRRLRTLGVGGRPVALAADDRYVAVADAGGGRLVRIDARHRRLAGPAVRLGGEPVAVALGPGEHAWVADAAGGTVRRVDLPTGRASAPIAVGPTPLAVAVDGGDVYVLCRGDRTLVRVDAGTGRVRARTHLSADPTALALDPRHVWIAAAEQDEVIRIDR